ncbi:hypothetical protein SESBI_19355 [Sesbania bispinosa]|nr:hypothetical protein SESBI_19355 [Sesbania bispinosa]
MISPRRRVASSLGLCTTYNNLLLPPPSPSVTQLLLHSATLRRPISFYVMNFALFCNFETTYLLVWLRCSFSALRLQL